MLVGEASSYPTYLQPRSGAAGSCPGILSYKVRSPTPWIFALSGFLAVSDLEILRVDALMYTLCLGGPCFDIELSLFDCLIFDVFRCDEARDFQKHYKMGQLGSYVI